MGFEWKSFIGTIAPTIATALGGPLAGAATAAIATSLGLSEDASEAAISKAMNNLTPEQIVQLKQADINFQTRMKELNIDLASLAVEDRKSARERETSTGDSHTPRLLAMGAVILFAISLLGTFALVFVPNLKVPETIMYLLGSVQSASALFLKSVYDYYMGDSSSSGIRDRMIYHSRPIEDITDRIVTTNTKSTSKPAAKRGA